MLGVNVGCECWVVQSKPISHNPATFYRHFKLTSVAVSVGFVNGEVGHALHEEIIDGSSSLFAVLTQAVERILTPEREQQESIQRGHRAFKNIYIKSIKREGKCMDQISKLIGIYYKCYTDMEKATASQGNHKNLETLKNFERKA